MKTFNCHFQSKNKKTLETFLKMLKCFLRKKTFKTRFKLKQSKKLTLLKSPHIHKTAQEHFQTKFYGKKISIKVGNIKKLSLIYKKILKFSFHDLKLKLDLLNKENFTSFFVLKVFYLNNYSSIKFKNCYFDKRIKTLTLIKLLNFNGTAMVGSV